ncbi:MAG: chemotaxis protein CheW [Bacteroidales bacterium]|nr:chemotaxis protein CheW [Bacteroidales bacterium]
MDNKSENHSYLSFAINEEIYAAKVHSVVEVLEQQPITLIPKSPKHIKGVVSFRGEIIPVIDARTIMNIPDHHCLIM